MSCIRIVINVRICIVNIFSVWKKKTLVKKKSNLLISVVVCGSVIYNDGVESSGMECN